MKDLIMHEGSVFVIPDTMTEDVRYSLTQAYISLFLTHLGTINLEPGVGVSFEIGKMQAENFKDKAQSVNHEILILMKDPYGITDIAIDSLQVDGDTVTMEVTITTDAAIKTTVTLTV